MNQICHKCGKVFEHERPRFVCKECFMTILPKRSSLQSEASEVFATGVDNKIQPENT